MARTVLEVRCPCRRGLHDACILTQIISRKTGRLMKQSYPVFDEECAMVGETSQDEPEAIITRFIKCSCECHQ